MVSVHRMQICDWKPKDDNVGPEVMSPPSERRHDIKQDAGRSFGLRPMIWLGAINSSSRRAKTVMSRVVQPVQSTEWQHRYHGRKSIISSSAEHGVHFHLNVVFHECRDLEVLRRHYISVPLRSVILQGRETTARIESIGPWLVRRLSSYQGILQTIVYLLLHSPGITWEPVKHMLL